VAVLAAATVLIALAAQPAAAAAPRAFYGVSPQTGLGTADLDRMGQAKVGTIRIPIFWSNVDPVAPAGGYDFSGTDPVVGDAARNGIEVLPFLYGTPAWVANDLNGSNCGNDCGTIAPTKPAAIDAWAGFVRAAVDRYGSNGTYWAENPTIPKQPIRAWQMWNEMNSKSFFAPKAKPKLYAKMLAPAAAAVRAGDPQADVVLGGMPQLAGSKKATPGSEYLEDLYKVKGAKKNFDGVAIHPYGSKVNKVAEQAELFTDVMKKARDKKASLWVTEIGAGSAKGGNPLNRGKSGQAKILKDSYKYFAKQRNKWNIETVIWFSWMDSQISICAWCKTSGLLTTSGQTKPAFKAFTKFTRGN
jgi:hypothetical protein